MKQVWFYDLEQFANFHSATFMSKDNDIRMFVLHSSRNDLIEYLEFLDTEVSGLIGFNNLKYDYPLLHYILKQRHRFQEMLIDDVVNELYNQSSLIINSEYSEIVSWRVLIPQLDLYRIWHFDNKAKRTSLKAVGIALKYYNIEDLPFPPDHWVNANEIEGILAYNLNDVDITRLFYEKTIPKIEMRKQFGKEYGISIINANDTQIGSKLIGKYLSEFLGIPSNILNKMRTYRKSIKINDCLVPYIKFNSKEFQSIYEKFQSKVITETKNAFDNFSVIYKGMKYDFGTGGIHGAIPPGIFDSDDNNKIILVDVSSYYPNLAIKNKFYPQHLTEKFCDIYDEIYQKRLVAKKARNKPIDSGLKLALNSAFGKSNDAYSFLYDPMFTMRITINGQLLLAQLAETIADANIPIIQINTDGIMVKCPVEKVDELRQICNNWEDLTKLKLDFDYFKRVVMRDVNNYIGVFTDSSVKLKGIFEIDKDIHKDHSMRIVRKAVHDYYVHGTSVEHTIRNHDDIYDFCFRFRATKGWKVIAYSLNYEDNTIKRTELSKNVRYFVANNGVILRKVHDDGREINILSDKTVVLFNRYFEKNMSEYNIDYNFYIAEAYDIINSVHDGQTKLF
jgi:hypothetical protein